MHVLGTHGGAIQVHVLRMRSIRKVLFTYYVGTLEIGLMNLYLYDSVFFP